MERDLLEPLPEPPIEAPSIEDVSTGNRIIAAERAAGIRPDPIVAAHLDDPTVFNRWVEIDDEPAAFGRLVVLGHRAYLSEIVTLPAFRRRGLAKSLIIHLIRDAQEADAQTCALTSSEMGLALYLQLGFEELIPLTGFQTPQPA
jgi:ribosomal protein S18 acetylase RimI-like enzyme